MSYLKTERECISIERINQCLEYSELKIVQKKNECENVNYIYEEEKKEKEEKEGIAIEFENVFMNTNDNNKNHGLKNISFKISKGSKIAFCGHDGCGKELIFDCLFKIWQLEKGALFFMGHKSDSYSIEELKSKIVYFFLKNRIFFYKTKYIVPALNLIYNGNLKSEKNRKVLSNIGKDEEKILDFLSNEITKDIIWYEEDSLNLDDKTSILF